MAAAILDTGIYIDHWERGLYQETLENLRRAILSAIRQSFYQSFGAALAGVRRSDSSPTFLNWPRPVGSLRWPAGGRQAGLSETSVISRIGTYTSVETFKTMR
jgi:hypothetical protein